MENFNLCNSKFHYLLGQDINNYLCNLKYVIDYSNGVCEKTEAGKDR